MLHYLFTNDLRHEAWPDILVDTATLIHEDKVPTAAQNKSKNNYICTQAFYLCIQKGTKANEYCRKGKIGPVVLNFINRFQFPNARTKESYEQSVGDGMSIAPLRVAVQLLFALRLVDRDQSRLSYDELVKYIVCNQRLVVGNETNLLALATQIVNDRERGITPPHLDSDGLAGKGVEWKHCPRQVKELFSLLEFAPFIRSTAVDVRLEIPESIDAGAAKQFFYIVNNRELWHASQATDWSDVQRSYQEYMEAGLTQFEVDVEPPSKIPALPEPNVNRLTVALKLFGERRLQEDWIALLKRDGYVGIRARYEGMNPETLRNMAAAEFDEWANKELWALQHYRCKQTFDKLTDEQKTACARFVAAVKKNVQPVTSYFPTTTNCPEGVGPVVATELLMKFHPQDYMGYSALMLDGMKALKLLDADPQYDTAIGYQKTMGIASQILEKMFAMKLTRSFDDEKYIKPDYITVNEFLWWVKTHQDLIKEKIMASTYKKTEIKKVEQKPIGDFSDFIKKLEDDIASARLKYASNLMKRFVCAQLAKPFVVLTGLSGSGKTKLAEAFTKWIGVENTVNIVPVGADWTNNEKLLGYPNALDPEKYVMPDTGVLKLMLDANENPDLPFFLILDEMNLSHVERYFADFLSTMESNDGIIELYDSGKRHAEDGREIPPSFPFPKNLFVIGTMNVDETTYMFSPKVLDRAQVIEFRVSEKEMADFLAKPGNPKIDDLAEKGAAYAKAFLDLAAERKTKDIGADEKKKFNELLIGKVNPKTKELDGLFTALAKLGAEFGYRSAIEMVIFIAYYLEASAYGKLTQSVDREKFLKDAIDAAVLQKLLPKLHGSLNRLGPVIDALISKVTITQTDQNGDSDTTLIYPLTYEKLLRMKDRVEKNGFTSFAEA